MFNFGSFFCQNSRRSPFFLSSPPPTQLYLLLYFILFPTTLYKTIFACYSVCSLIWKIISIRLAPYFFNSPPSPLVFFPIYSHVQPLPFESPSIMVRSFSSPKAERIIFSKRSEIYEERTIAFCRIVVHVQAVRLGQQGVLLFLMTSIRSQKYIVILIDLIRNVPYESRISGRRNRAENISATLQRDYWDFYGDVIQFVLQNHSTDGLLKKPTGNYELITSQNKPN